MPVELKFCGLTRETDAAYAVSLGAAYVGVIFAEGPRRIDPSQAGTVLGPARGRARTVGVFGPASIEGRTLATNGGGNRANARDPSPGGSSVRPFFGGEVWRSPIAGSRCDHARRYERPPPGGLMRRCTRDRRHGHGVPGKAAKRSTHACEPESSRCGSGSGKLARQCTSRRTCDVSSGSKAHQDKEPRPL